MLNAQLNSSLAYSVLFTELAFIQAFRIEILKSRFLLRRLVIYCIQRVHYVHLINKLEDNKEGKPLSFAILDSVFGLLMNIFHECSDVFVPEEIWDPFFVLLTTKQDFINNQFSLSLVKHVEKRNRRFSGKNRIRELRHVFTDN